MKGLTDNVVNQKMSKQTTIVGTGELKEAQADLSLLPLWVSHSSSK